MSKSLGAMLRHQADNPRVPDNTLPIPMAKIGIEVELEKCRRPVDVMGWTYKSDNSLRNNGVEYTTDGPIYGAAIAPAVRDLCAQATLSGWDEGYPRAGIHVHLDVRDLDFDAGQLARLVGNYMVVEHAMFGFAGEWRRATCYCDGYDDGQADFSRLGKLLFNPPKDPDSFINAASNLSKYQALNLRALVEFGTVEFRHLPTTFNYERIMDWIRVILAIKRSCLVQETRNPIHILSAMGPDAYFQHILGDTAHILLPYINRGAIWQAVDNATALMAYGNSLKTKREPRGWDAVAPEPNPLIEKYAAARAEARKKSPAKKAPTARRSVQADAAMIATIQAIREQFELNMEEGDI